MADTFARMRQLIGTTADWAANDLVIGLGEFALETIGATTRLKVGDGIKKFSELAYFDPGIFDYVLASGDTMTGPLIVPELSVTGPATVSNGVTVTGGNSSFAGPVNLGAAATAAHPGSLSDDDNSVPTTHWVQQQVGGIITGLELKGTWNAATNTPPLASGGAGVPTPERGDFYLVSVSGSTNLDGISTWNAGDSVVFNGVSWQRVPQTLFDTQIIAALGYTPADEADLAALDAAVIKKDIIDAAGDLIVGTAADTPARLARGTAGQVLTAGASGIAWATPPTGWRSLGVVDVTSATAAVDFTGLPSDINHLMAFYRLLPTTNDRSLVMQFYDASGVLDSMSGHYQWSNYYQHHGAALNAALQTSTSTNGPFTTGILLSSWTLGVGNASMGVSGLQGSCRLFRIRDATQRHMTHDATYLGPSGQVLSGAGGGWRNIAAGGITGLRWFFQSDTIANGNVELWGSP